MDQRSPSFEASLLFRTATQPVLDDVIEDLQAVIEINGEILEQVEQIDDIFTVLTCGTVQVLLAVCPEALPVAHFMSAQRPGAASLSEHEILVQLTDMAAMITVLVIERDDICAPLSLMRNLCWDITESLFEDRAADMVFWSDTDILYDAEEFDRACSYAAYQARSDAGPEATKLYRHPGIPGHFRQEPVIDFAALPIMDRPTELDHMTESVAAPQDRQRRGVKRLLSPAIPPQLTLVIGRLQNGIRSARVKNRAAMVCTMATVSLTLLPNLYVLIA